MRTRAIVLQHEATLVWQARLVTEAFTTALIAELGKKTGVCWLRYDTPDEPEGQGRPRPAWHVWHDDALLVVAGGAEQPLPDLEDAARVEVTMRSKENGGRLVTWVGVPSVIRPGDDRWDEASAALVADRLNLEDLGTAADDWAARSVVVRIEPTAEVVEDPATLDDGPLTAPPPSSPATTRGALPRVLHRRKRGRPDLS